MATREELYTALRNADASGDAAGAAKLAAYIQAMPPEDGPAAPAKAAPVNKDKEAGAGAPGALRGLMSVVNGPALGFGDEILGAVGGAYDTMVKGGTFSDNYKGNRDYVRGAQEREAQDNPIFTALTQGMASAPLMLVGGAPAASVKGSNELGVLARMWQAAKTGTAYGAVGGAGNSTAEDIGGVLKDSAISAGTSGVLGAAGVPVAGAVNAMGRNAIQRVSQTAAGNYAQQKVAQAVARDARGAVAQAGDSNPLLQVASRFRKLGDEATVTDAAGRNTNQLLDTLATLPGQTKDTAEQLIRTRQAGRAGRLIESAETNLGTAGQRLAPNLDQWATQRAQASAPLYNQVRQIDVNPTNNLTGIVRAADELGALDTARKIATANQQKFGLEPYSPNQWNMGDLDHVKQGLDQLIAKQWDAAAGKLTPLGASYQGLKNRLTAELDTITTDPKTGASVYKAARDAYAGPSAIIDAANQGRLAISKDGAAISQITGDLSDSEMQAFRLGAFESLRSKLGKEGGQTEILKMWKEPATREKLQAVFGDESAFRQFAADVAKESRLKGLESVGRGSQTAARQYGAGDLDVGALGDAGGALMSAKTGNPLSAIGSMQRAWNGISTPQAVRDEMGKILMSKGAAGEQNINALMAAMQAINKRDGTIAKGSGVAGGLIGSKLATPIPVRQ